LRVFRDIEKMRATTDDDDDRDKKNPQIIFPNSLEKRIVTTKFWLPSPVDVSTLIPLL